RSALPAVGRWPLVLTVPIGLIWLLPNLHRTVTERIDPLATYDEVRRLAERIDAGLSDAGIVAPTVLTPDIGGFGYGPAALRVIDLGRLVDTTLAHHGYTRPVFTDYVFDQRRPTFIRTHHRWTTESRLTDEPAFTAGYVALRYWTENGAPGGEFLRRDALIGDLPGEAQVVAPADRAGFATGLELRGWESVTLPGEAGQLRLWLYWARVGPVASDFGLAVRVGGVDGAAVATVDHEPTSGLLPATTWPEGEVVRDFVAVPLPAGLPAGEYTLAIGRVGAPEPFRPVGTMPIGSSSSQPPATLAAIEPLLARGNLTAAVGAFRRLAAGRPPADPDLLPILDRIRERGADLARLAGDGRTAARLAAELWPFSGWGTPPAALRAAADECAARADRARAAGDLEEAVRWQVCASDLVPADPARRHALEDLRTQAFPLTLPALPPDATPIEATFGRRLRLLGYAIDPAPPLTPGRPVTLHLYFESLARVTTDYEISVHLESPVGRVGADHYPPIATSRWRPGQVISDRVTVIVPPGAAGLSTLWVGVTDRREPLSVTAGPARNDGQRVLLGDLISGQAP
ncbi:MAG TPA: hypothetical protein VHL09_12920, partial [Dehalococcoidia bacterium]|nr:hypothetical protein [Dehalococcoidia bacterium]